MTAHHGTLVGTRRFRFAVPAILLLGAWACGNGGKQPPPASPEPAPPTVVSVAAPEPSAPVGELESPPPPRASTPPSEDPSVTVGSSDDVHVEIERDAGYFSFRARTVRDGGFSFRMQGSVTVSGDGGSVHIQIGGDGGAP